MARCTSCGSSDADVDWGICYECFCTSQQELVDAGFAPDAEEVELPGEPVASPQATRQDVARDWYGAVQPAAGTVRCKTTGNPVGTDTWMAGKECGCDSCLEYSSQLTAKTLTSEATTPQAERPNRSEKLARWIWANFVGIPITEPYDKEYVRLFDHIEALQRLWFTKGLTEARKQTSRSVAPVETPKCPHCVDGKLFIDSKEKDCTTCADVETRLTAEQLRKKIYDFWKKAKADFWQASWQALVREEVQSFEAVLEASAANREYRLQSKLQWLLANLCAKHADINTCSSGPCAMCEAARLREEIERLKEGERSVRDFLERDYGISEITTICSRYDDATHEITELRAKLARYEALEAHLPSGFAIGDDATAELAIKLAEEVERSNQQADGLAKDYESEHELRKAAEAEAAALRELERWIPVEEKLPTEKGFYIVFPGRKLGHAEVFYYTQDCYWIGPDAEYPNQTHWKALSATPEPEAKS